MDLMQAIQFTPLKAEDIRHLQRWLRKSHILKFWSPPMTDQEIEQKYLLHIASNWVFPYLILCKNQPIGYIQSYHAIREGSGWWENESPGTYGLDLFIGEESFLNQGIGSQILNEFIFFFTKDHLVSQWIVDVSPDNHKAIRCFEKAGFARDKEILTPEGPALLMKLHREGFSYEP